MTPSQGGGWPSLSGNGDPNSVGQACGAAPIAQVKILRRPKPHENNQQSTSRADESAKNSNSTSGAINAESGRKSEQASIRSPSHYVNDDEWPSIADAESKNFGSQKQKHNVLKKPADTKSVSNGGTNQTIPSETLVSSIVSKPTGSNSSNSMLAATQSNFFETNKAPKAPIKTYKERADEYAKARLRILGSAFSDEDRPNNVDIMNIHRNVGDG